ncbi:YggS family pyridoxal phosphate-dependent enzyme [Actinomarinicola tropica]|uniref:Pyridoxal phosphate homeostasis protein n=1 Tax=Actinomarinicola tropica TaxID=2789776 RepID=A0A5Q2RKU6_9ACTN|nr:YggS family pyridoxal phosphate-dependent enzyme [Actinomarinicola tropica]QGG95542.1 YggS family pyridoxal phosphate-dependent enzyme [Actinomarinicola tropica]
MTGTVADRLDVVRARLAAAGAEPGSIQVLAVTKGFGPDVVRAAGAHGLVDVGENYAQEMLAKVDALADLSPAPRWHAIGRLQRNKVRQIAPHVHLWQSVDRLPLGEEIARRAPGARVLVQVDATDEPGKGGCPLAELDRLVGSLIDLGLDVDGLMTVGPTDPEVDPRPAFDRVRAARDRLGLRTLSMGMSRDLEAAVACGTTMVRLGTALFGPRRVSPPGAK